MRRCFDRDTPLGTRGLTLVVASVWLVHGLHKVLHGSPRTAIVQSVPGLSGDSGEQMIMAVGAFEIAPAVWVVSGVLWCVPRFNRSFFSMNVVELTVARHLLLWPAGLILLNLAFLGLAWPVASSRTPGGLRRDCGDIPFRSTRTSPTASR